MGNAKTCFVYIVTGCENLKYDAGRCMVKLFDSSRWFISVTTVLMMF